MNKESDINNIHEFMNNFIKKYKLEDIISETNTDYCIEYKHKKNLNVFEVILNNKDEQVSFKLFPYTDIYTSYEYITISYKDFIKDFTHKIDNYYDEVINEKYDFSIEKIFYCIICFDKIKFNEFIEQLILKDSSIIKSFNKYILDHLSDELKNKYDYLFNANNFDLI